MILDRYNLFALILLVFAATPAIVAQSVTWSDFYPLTESDEWIYRYTEEVCDGAAPFSCTVEQEMFLERTVVGEFAGNRALMDINVYDQIDQPPTCTAEYGVWFDESVRRIRRNALEGLCDLAFGEAERRAIPDQTPADQTVTIGEAPYSVSTVETNIGEGGVLYSALFGEGIGLLAASETQSTGGGGSMVSSYTLEYAVVGGAVYGSVPTPVASEGEITPSVFALGAAYPNPSRSTTTLAMSVPTAEAVTVEVFDVLGRRVLERDLGVQPAGTQPVTLDLGMVPAGVYFARATTALGQTATRRIVRVE